MNSPPYIKIFFLLLAITITDVARGHIEGNLFLEHPPNTNAGILVQSARYEVNDNAALSLSPFVEYASHPKLSFGAGLPLGYYQDQFQISDAVLAVKSAFSISEIMVIPTASLELPTGNEPVTAHHAELVPAVFVEKKIPDLHLYGLLQARFALGESDHTETVNPLFPHAENELDGTLGISYWITNVLGIDARLNGYFEHMESMHPGMELGMVYQITTHQDITVKASIGYYTVSSGIRDGRGIGFSFYIAP